MNYTYSSMPVKQEVINDIDYSQSNIGDNPTINLAIGRMQYIFQDVGIGAGNFAINVAHVYNSKLNATFANKILGLGNKWKLNLTQCVVNDNYDSTTGKSILKYMDESGEIHRYISYDTNKWFNDSKATSIIELIDGNYILSDGVGNKLYFNTDGYLFKSVSCQNSNIVKVYKYDSNNRLVSVYDQRTLQDSIAKNRIDLTYNSLGNLEKMIAYANNTHPVIGYRYEYDSNNNLVAVVKIAYGSKFHQVAEKQILEFRYESGNMTMIIDSETKVAKLIQYDTSGKVSKLSNGFIKENSLTSGMFDSANNSFSIGDKLELGLSCASNFVEKSYNTFKYKYNATGDTIAVETDVTNECDITLRYYIDRQASITSSFEHDKRSKNGENLKTLTKFEGQKAPSDTTSEFGYINGCGTFVTSEGKFSRTVDPIRFVSGLPVQLCSNFNYSFWLKTKKNYELLEVKATYKRNTIGGDEPSSEKTVMVNAQAAGAWQRVVIPLVLPINTPTNFHTVNVSFIVNKDTESTDDFEINEIGLSPAPCAELMLATKETSSCPLSVVKKVKITEGSLDNIVEFGADFYLTESDIISTYTNKYKRHSETFDLIYNNGTKRRSNVKDIKFYSPWEGWSDYSGQKPFYIHTVLPVKDAQIKTYYKYDSDGFVIENDYKKTIDDTNYESSSFVKMDYTGKTLSETDEYGITKNYKYDLSGNLIELSVGKESETQSKQIFHYDSEGNLDCVDDGLNKQKITYNEASQPQKIEDSSYQNGIWTDTGHSVTNKIGIFGDKPVCISEYDEDTKIGSTHLTYEQGQIRTISDGLVKYGVQQDFLKDCVLYTQFDGQEEKPIQLDAISGYWKKANNYYNTNTSKYYDETGKVIDGSSVDLDAYGKPVNMAIGCLGSYQYDNGSAREKYLYIYKDGQESEFIKKLSICRNLNDYSSKQYRYDDADNLIGWKEVETQKTVFEVNQIAPTTTKYIFGDKEQEYFVQVNYDKNKMAAPRMESVVVQEDEMANVDRPTELFTTNYKWNALGNLEKSSTKFSTEEYTYLNLHNNSLLQNVEYGSKVTDGIVTWGTEASDNLQYYNNGLLKQETISHQTFRNSNISDKVTSTKTFQYDNLHRITKEINTGLGISRTYSYYPNGRLKKIAGITTADTKDFVYDSKGRLTSINNSTNFAYDNYGNRISKTEKGVTINYAFDVGGRLVSAGGVKYSYNAEGIRCKKTSVANGISERMYLDGGKILGEDRADCKLRYFYDATGLKRIRKIDGDRIYDYECVKDRQGSIVMLIDVNSGLVTCRYEYDAFGKCTILEQSDDAGDTNPFRWKGFYYDTESGFYYANGSYYDPETGLYVDAAPISVVIDNAGSPRHIDRNGTLCYNPLAIAGNPYMVFTTVEMDEDLSYDPGEIWWEKINAWWDNICRKISTWWEETPAWQKVLMGVILLVASVVIAIASGGSSAGPEAKLLGGMTLKITVAAKTALIELSIGVGFAVADWVANAAWTGNWDIGALENSVADSTFFTGAFMFISASINAIKYVSRSMPNPTDELAKCAGYCFMAGTLVHCEDGLKRIEDVKVGDKVLAYNEETGEQDYKTVLHLFRNESKDWTGITVNDKEIVSTPGHKYYLPLTKQWVSAKDLKIGDTVLLSNGQQAKIQTTRSIHYETPQTTYNFEVEDFHTYYVETGVLVHNMDCGDTIYVDTVDDALDMAEKHLGPSQHYYKGNNNILVSDMDPRKVVRFDIDVNNLHVRKVGQHLNIETYRQSFGINGQHAIKNIHVKWRN